MKYITFPADEFEKFVRSLPLRDVEPECSPGEEWGIEWAGEGELCLVKKAYNGTLLTKVTYLSSEIVSVLKGTITSQLR